MPIVEPGPRLDGRQRECAVLDRLIDGARAGRSGVLVLRGEAGVGKTALLDHVLRRASGCRVLRVSGVESEMELAFAGLHVLCAPFLARLDHLPGPQAEALGTTFGLRTGPPPDRFLVGLAVLGLLADVAEERPLLCVIDDAQWLDRASVQALAFVARRLAAEPIAVVFAVRDTADDQGLAGLDELAVHGLRRDDARALLASAVAGPLDERVGDRIVAETRGNPLALLELPRGLTPAEMAGGFGMSRAMPLTGRIEQGFLRRLTPLPLPTRRLLLTAAAEPVGDAALLWRAAERLGIDADAAGPAVAAGLIDFGAQVRFRHPLVRSAAYRAAGPRDLRAVHRALADVTDPDTDPDRRAWHRSQASLGPDEEVAAELTLSAERARRRGGMAAAAAFLERATVLTSEPAARGERALAAAQAMFEAAAPEAALDLLATAELCPLDALQQARLERLRAELTFARHRAGEAPALLRDAARRLEPLDADLARQTYLEALGAGIFAGRLRAGELRETAEAARAAPSGHVPPRPADLLLDGLATRFTDGYVAAVTPLRKALAAFTDKDGHDDMTWMWLAWPVAYELWDDDAWHQLTVRFLAFARDSGALALLPLALIYRAQLHTLAGEFAAAAALHGEVDLIRQATLDASHMYSATTSSGPLVLAAWRGDERRASALIDAGARDATARGEGRAIALADYARAVLYNGLGRYEDALEPAERACRYDDLALHGWSLTELVEAAVRSGRDDTARVALRSLTERTSASGTDWALGAQACARALVSEGDDAERLYREAIDRLVRTRIHIASARARLVYGEWLRRENRRVDARHQLRSAHELLAGIGMDAFAERARRELQATGEKTRKRTVDTRDDLTAQEAQIARLAGEGRTNPEIGSQLFISSRTVEWHLRKVFTKLRITSRRELRLLVPTLGAGPRPT